MNVPTPRFCSQCGSALVDRFVDLENRVRRMCTQCGEISYLNPQILVSTIVMAGDRVLLCRRADPPAVGGWVLPGGFMERDETLEEAAARELREETGVHIDPSLLRPYAVASLPEIGEVYVGYLATVSELTRLVCGSECTEVRFFNEQDVPWSEFAYPDVAVYLRVYFDERRNAMEVIHFGSIDVASVVSKSYRIAAATTGSRLRAESMTSPSEQVTTITRDAHPDQSHR